MKRYARWLVTAGLLAVVLLVVWRLNRQGDPHYFTAKVERGAIRDVVEATGTISAVVTVQVGSQVSGTIAKLNADFNSRVHKGDLVAIIDPALFQGAFLQATADLENAKANLVAAEANLEKARAGVVQNVVTYDTIVDFDNRDLKLFPGMTAYATIPIATVENTLKVPNAALRYKPPLTVDEIRGLYRKHEIDESPAQAAPAAAPIAQGTTGGSRQADGASQPSSRKEPLGATAVVWRLRAKGALEPVQVGLGITDHSFTELTVVVRGQLQEGDEIITGSVGGGAPGGPALPGGVRR